MSGRAMLCCAALVSFVLPVTTLATSTPQVTFLLMRLDRETISLQHAYRYTQPLRKHLVPGGFEDWGELFVRFEYHGDVNNTEQVLSRYTGQNVFSAVWHFQMEGNLVWPTSTQEVTDRATGSPAPDPQRLTVLPMWKVLRPGERDAIWTAVRDFRMVQELATISPIHGVIFDFDFDGEAWGDDPEILLLLWARDAAPVDAALVKQAWPRTLITFGVRMTPEVTLYNFSDEPIDVSVRLEALKNEAVIYTSSRTVAAVGADATLNISFDPMVPLSMEPLSFRATLASPAGGAWLDAYPENDTTSRDVGLTARPVFRSRGSADLPLYGKMLDFDGDGDLDVVQDLWYPRFQQRGADGRYSNISSRVTPPLEPDFSQSLAGEFTGDGLQDVLLNYYGVARLLAGDGTGSFQAAGLTGIPQVYNMMMEIFDLDLDGDHDILTRNSYGGRQGSAFFLEGPARFVEDPARTGLSPAELNGRPAMARIDGDERPDLVVARPADATDVYINAGSGFYQRAARLAAADLAVPLDYDADGRMDLLNVVTSAGARLFRQAGPLDFVDVTSQAGDVGGTQRWIYAAGAADLNADGRPDLVMSTNQGLKLKLTEQGLYQDAAESLVERGPGYVDAIQLLDWDADGDTDIYTYWAAFENQGMPLPRVGADVRLRAGSATARLPVASLGWLEVTLIGSTALDVRQVELSTVTFGPDRTPVPPDAPVRYEDANHDGIQDLGIRYRRAESGLEPDAREACLEGWTRQGLPFGGCAALVPVGAPR